MTSIRKWQLIAAAVPAIAAATATVKTTTFFACVINKSGGLHLVSSTAKCGTGEHKISWNNVGPKGPKGPQGSPGAQGLPGVATGYIDSNNGAALSNSSETTVTTLKLPAGKFLVIARVEPAFTNTSASPDLVDCSIEIAGSESAIAGGGTTLIPGVGQTSGESLSLIGATSIVGKSGGKIAMTCKRAPVLSSVSASPGLIRPLSSNAGPALSLTRPELQQRRAGAAAGVEG